MNSRPMNWSQVWADFWNNDVEKLAALVAIILFIWGVVKFGGKKIADFFKGIVSKIDDCLRKHYTKDEPETQDGPGFLPDRNQAHWEVHASNDFAQPVEIPVTPDGTGCTFTVPIWARNVGWKLTPAFTLEVHSPSPYVLHEVRDYNANLITEAIRSPLSDKHRFWWMVAIKHLTPLSMMPVNLGYVRVTIHAVRIPPVLELKWRVVLSGGRYYPTNSYLWFNVNLRTQPLQIPDLPEQPPMPGETLEAGGDQ